MVFLYYFYLFLIITYINNINTSLKYLQYCLLSDNDELFILLNSSEVLQCVSFALWFVTWYN